MSETNDNDNELGVDQSIPISAESADMQKLQVKLLRLQADFDNHRRRTANARGEAAGDARRETLADLLPIYDNFVRALEHAEESPELLPFLSGFEMIRQQIDSFFAKHEMEPIMADEGVEFDPNLHEANGLLPVEEGCAEGTIAKELQKGFTFRGTVVRPSRVLVYG